MKLKNLFLLILALQSNICKGFISRSLKFYNKELNQTIVLLGDIHWKMPTDAKQLDDFMQEIKKNNPYVIIEGGYKPGNYIPSLLSDTYFCLISNKTPICDVEFRRPLLNILHLVNKCDDWEINEMLLNDRIFRQDLTQFFISSEREINKVLYGIDCYTKNLTPSNLIQAKFKEILIRETNKIKTTKDKIHESFLKKLKQNINNKNLANMLINFFMKDKRKCNHKNTAPMLDFVLDKIYWGSVDLLDLIIIKEILKQLDKKLIFVYSGDGHIKNIEKFLYESGYELKYDVGFKWEEEIFKKHAEILKKNRGVLKMSEFEKYIVDVKDFFDKCMLD